MKFTDSYAYTRRTADAWGVKIGKGTFWAGYTVLIYLFGALSNASTVPAKVQMGVTLMISSWVGAIAGFKAMVWILEKRMEAVEKTVATQSETIESLGIGYDECKEDRKQLREEVNELRIEVQRLSGGRQVA